MKAQQLQPGEPLFLKPGYGPGFKSMRDVTDDLNKEIQARRVAEQKAKEEFDAKIKADPEWATRPSTTFIIPKGGIRYGR